MKNVVKVTALSLGLALASGFAAADENIAFINAGYLFQNHPDRQAVADKLDAEFKPMADKLTASKKEIDDKIVASRKKVEAKVAALQKDAPRLRAKEIQARQDKIMASQKGFQNKVEALQKREAAFAKKAEAFQQKAEAFQKKIEDANKNSGGLNPQEAQKQAVDEINVTIKEVAKAKGYTLVLQPQVALYAEDESKDITEAVLDAIKAKHPEIKLPEPKAEEQPAAEAPKAAEEAKPQATEEAKK